MATIASLNILTKVSTAGLVSGLKKGQQSLQSFGEKVTSVKGMLLGFGAAMGAGYLFSKAKSFVGWGIELAADAETAQVAFETLIGSTSRAKTLLADLKKFSAKTPFEFTDVRQASQTLLNFGVNVENVMPMVSRLGDIASGDAEKLKSLSLAFGQASSKGKLQGDDLKQMINVGFNPLLVISQKTGESMAELSARMSTGGVSARELTEAIVTATSAGGQFYNMSEKQSQTLAGRWSSLRDAIGTVATTLGTKLLPIAGTVVDTLSSIIGSKGFSQILETVFQYGRVIKAEFAAIFDMLLSVGKSILPENVGNWQDWLGKIQDVLIAAEYGFTNWREALAIASKWTQLKAVEIYESFKYAWDNAGQLTTNFADAILGLVKDINFNIGVAFNNGLVDLVDNVKINWNEIGSLFAKAGKALWKIEKKKWTALWELAKWGWNKLKNPQDDLDSANFGISGAIFNVATGGNKKEYRDIGKNFMDALRSGLPDRPLSPLEQALGNDLANMENSFGKGFRDFWKKRKQEMNAFQDQTETVVDDISFTPEETPAQQFGKWLSENKDNLKRGAFNFGQGIKDWFYGLGGKGIKREREAIEIKQPELIFKGSQEANKALFDWKNLFDGSGPQDPQKEMSKETKTQTSILQDMLKVLKDKYIPQPVQDIVMSF